MKIKSSSGCSYGHVLNQKVSDMKENMNKGFKSIEDQLLIINKTQTHLFNHMSGRMTKGAVAMWCALIGVISTLLSILGTILFK
jgi:hypothetical protein